MIGGRHLERVIVLLLAVENVLHVQLAVRKYAESILGIPVGDAVQDASVSPEIGIGGRQGEESIVDRSGFRQRRLVAGQLEHRGVIVHIFDGYPDLMLGRQRWIPGIRRGHLQVQNRSWRGTDRFVQVNDPGIFRNSELFPGVMGQRINDPRVHACVPIPSPRKAHLLSHGRVLPQKHLVPDLAFRKSRRVVVHVHHGDVHGRLPVSEASSGR